MEISQPNNRSFSFRKLNSTFFHKFSTPYYDSVLSFFAARQVSEIILNESSKSTENAIIELRIRVILETCTWKLPGISYFADLRQTRCARKSPKPVLETTLITKETTYTLDFRKCFVVSFWSHSIRAFSVLLEDSLRIISET
jgi:hypothetical protein